MLRTNLLRPMLVLMVGALIGVAVQGEDQPMPGAGEGLIGALHTQVIEPGGNVRPAPRIGVYFDSGCLENDNGELEWPCGDDEFEFTVEGSTLYVVHLNATYNCCRDDIVVSLSMHGNVLELTEREVLIDPCDCWCCYDVDASVLNLAPGRYSVEYSWFDYETWEDQCYVEDIVVHGDPEPTSGDGAVVGDGSGELSPNGSQDVGPGLVLLPPPSLAGYSNTGCLQPQGEEAPCEEEDEIIFSVRPNTLDVLHRNATYNCCLDEIAIEFFIEGQVITLIEEEIVPDACYCICCFDADATIVNLPPGLYTVEFWWFDYEANEPRCYIEDVQIP